MEMTPSSNDMNMNEDHDGTIVPVLERMHGRQSGFKIKTKRRKTRFRKTGAVLSLSGKEASGSMEEVSLSRRIFNLETSIMILFFTAILLACMCAFLYRANRKQRAIIETLVQSLKEMERVDPLLKKLVFLSWLKTTIDLTCFKILGFLMSTDANIFGPVLII